MSAHVAGEAVGPDFVAVDVSNGSILAPAANACSDELEIGRDGLWSLHLGIAHGDVQIEAHVLIHEANSTRGSSGVQLPEIPSFALQVSLSPGEVLLNSEHILENARVAGDAPVRRPLTKSHGLERGNDDWVPG